MQREGFNPPIDIDGEVAAGLESGMGPERNIIIDKQVTLGKHNNALGLEDGNSSGYGQSI